MNNFWNKTNTILSLIAIVVAIVIGWYFNRDKNTSINIEEVNATLLTQNLQIDGLSVNYLYHDSIEVKNLWKTLFALKNTGEQVLYGKGFSEMNVRNGLIPIKIIGCEKLLSLRIKNCNNGVVLNKTNDLIITQWKPNEYVEIEVLSEGTKAPQLKINERGIKDASISYSQYTPSTFVAEPRLIDKLPNPIRSIIKWVIIVVMVILILVSVFQIPAQIKEKPTPVKISTLILMIFFIAIIISPILWMF